MKKVLCTAAALGATLLMGVGQASAVSSETNILLQLLQDKGVITQADAQQFKTVIDQKMAEEAKTDPEHYHTVQGMARRIEKLEKGSSSNGLAGNLSNKVQLGGVVEVRATAGSVNYKDNATTPDEDTSDIALATAELDIDANINKYVNAHLALLYEEDGSNNDGSGITVDEGIINIDGGDQMPLYLRAGKMFLPFGYYDSHFITDPTTLVLGRIKDTAAIAGYHNDMFDVNVGVFNGAVHEIGDDNKVDSFVGSATYTMPEGSINGLGLMIGISYTSNMAASDSLQEAASIDVHGNASTVADTGLTDMTGGYSAFLHMDYMDYSFDAEYLAAADSFNAGDMDFIDADNDTPAAWNFEIAAHLMPKLEAALRYGGSSEAGGYGDIAMPQSQFGGIMAYDLLEDTSLSFEYVHGEYKNETDDDLATLQLAVEF
jgi:hypothetical protein